MPGAPAPAPSPMPQIGGFNLPAPGPSTGQQLSNALGAMPGMLQQQQMDKYTLQKQKAEADKLEQTQDLARLRLLTRMAASSQKAGTQLSPDFTAAAEKLAKALGVGSFMHTDPGTGQQALDLDAMKKFSSGKDVSDLTADEIDKIWSQPAGKGRDGLLAAHGVDPDSVDKEAREAPAQIDPYHRDMMLNRMNQEILDFSKGNASLPALKAMIQGKKNELEQFGMDMSYLEPMIDSPEFAQQMSAGIKLKADALAQAGVKAQYVNAYYKARTDKIPFEIQDILGKADYRHTMAGIAQENVGLRADEINQKSLQWTATYNENLRKDGALINRYNVLNAATESGTPVKLHRAEYQAFEASSKRWQAAADGFDKLAVAIGGQGGDIDPALLQQAKDAHAKADAANQAMDAIVKQQPYMPSARASAAAGKTVVPADPSQSPYQPSGTKYITRAKAIEIGRQHGLTPDQAIKDAMENYGYTIR